MKKVISVFLALVIMVSVFGIMLSCSASGNSNIYYDNGKTYYKLNGKIQKGWILDTSSYTDKYYYADSNGVLQTGWKKIKGKWYYFEKDIYDPVMYSNTVSQLSDGKLYAFEESGALTSKTGWVQYSFPVGARGYDAWFYIEKGGIAAVGWKKLNGKWYYLQENGEMCSECGCLVGKKVYVFEKSGALTSKTGWVCFQFTAGYNTYKTWYYVTKGGVAKTGWQKFDGKWYYFDKDYGYMYSNGSRSVDGTMYVFEKSGALTEKVGWLCIYQPISYYDSQLVADWYYVKKGGIATTYWKKIGGKWYYFGSFGEMYSDGGYTLSDGKKYYFDKNGVCLNP